MEENMAVDSQRQYSVFVAMPFAPEFENVFDFGIRLPLEASGYAPIRTDKQPFTGSVVEEIQRGIRESSFIIADISNSNPNVLFELGYAIGCDKRSVVICRRGDALPFDVSGMSVIFYDPLVIRELKSTVEELLNNLHRMGVIA
jgi:hypothetical protein